MKRRERLGQGLFKTAALSLRELGLCSVLSSVIFWGVELQKGFLRRVPQEAEKSS